MKKGGGIQMEMTITAKIKILPSVEEVELLKKTMDAYRTACNDVSQLIFETKELRQPKLHKMKYTHLRESFQLKSQMAQSVMKTVIARYKSIKSNGHDWSLVKFKLPEYDLVFNRDYSFNKEKISINTLEGRVKLNYHAEGMETYFNEGWEFGTAKLVHKHKKWFLHIPMTKELPDFEMNQVNKIVGIDLGVNFIATTYDSKGKTLFFNGKAIKHKRAQYAKVRKELQQKQTSSARKRLKKIGSRENRWMNDVNHTITKALVNRYGKDTLFVLEDLTGIRNVTEKVRLKDRYATVSWAFYDFRTKLEYKAHLHSSKAIFVDPAYTSQTCPKCGHVDKTNRNKKLHLFKCKACHYTSNDDRIGAMNLHRKGIEYRVAVNEEQALR